MYNILPQVKALGEKTKLCCATLVPFHRDAHSHSVMGPIHVDRREDPREMQVIGFLGFLQSERVGAFP